MWLLRLMTAHGKWNGGSDAVMWPDMHLHAAFQHSIWNPWIIKQKMFKCMQLRKASFNHLYMPFPENITGVLCYSFSNIRVLQLGLTDQVRRVCKLLSWYKIIIKWTFFWEDPKKVQNHSSGFSHQASTNT